MNGWTPEQLKDLEERASRIKSLWSRAGFLHSQTGLMWHVCIAWAQKLRGAKNGTKSKGS